MDRETLEIVRAFVAESLDSLDEQEGKIRNLTQSDSKESIKSIFRVFHTIKGLSSFLGFNIINAVTQEVETLLDLLRNKPEAIAEGTLQLLSQSFDVLRILLKSVNTALKDTGHEEVVRGHIGQIKQAASIIKLGNVTTIEIVPQPSSVSVTTSFVDIAPTLIEAQEIDKSNIFDNTIVSKQNDDTTSEGSVRNIRLERNKEPLVLTRTDYGEFDIPLGEDVFPLEQTNRHFQTEAFELIVRVEEGCARLEQNPYDMTVIGSMFGAIHRLRESSAMRGFAELESMSLDIENIFDAVRKKTLEIYPGLISMVLAHLESMKAALEHLTQGQQSIHTKPFSSPVQTAVRSSLSIELPTHKYRRIESDKLEHLFNLVNELVTIESLVTNNSDIIALELDGFNTIAEKLHAVTRELQEAVTVLHTKSDEI
jgi:chemotaxis protein histidine kinase CheA